MSRRLCTFLEILYAYDEDIMFGFVILGALLLAFH
jgi:hypothetical protein